MSASTREGDRARLRAEVALAARILSPIWPLETFIAVNPLGGLEDRPFGDAIAAAGAALGARGTLDEAAFRERFAGGRITGADLRRALRLLHPELVAAPPVPIGDRTVTAEELLECDLLHGVPAPPPVRAARTRAEDEAPGVAEAVDAATARWCGAYFDGGQAAWPMPGRELGLYGAWRRLAARDRSLPAAARERLARLPEHAEDAALEALADLGVCSGRREYLRAHLTAMPGWASYARGSGDLTDLLALRLALEAALLSGVARPAGPSHAPPPRAVPAPRERAAHAATVLGAAGELGPAADVLARLGVDERPLVWLAAYEGHYRDELLARLAGQPAAGEAEGRPRAQVVCCIDARSEGLRRHLEARGPYETLGFAGFFAVAIRYQDLRGGAPTALCPVLLEPVHDVREQAVAGTEDRARRRVAGERVLASATDSFHAAKDDAGAPFVLAEASGWSAGPLAAAKTLLAGPYGGVRDRLRRAAAPPAPTVVAVERAIGAEERFLFAEVALTMMGLVRGFGRLVALCGHGSRTENNPYASALDCGACGGNAGGPNARTAAAILNGADVREHLAQRGIHVPADTWFVAAEHDTASDRVELLDPHLVPESHREDLAALADDLAGAGRALSQERVRDLPGGPRRAGADAAARHVRARGRDWAQVFPEWGLAGNAAFVVGPRAMTRGIDLGRRCFLHSYDAGTDPDGSALETILTAPLVVAQWINCQYYFSTVDPAVFGAGSKTIHNVVGGVGVLAGHDGDLKLGLPWQSVADGRRLVHEPMRLLAVVQAPLERIGAIVERNTVLEHLFGNGWVALAARETPDEDWQRHTGDGWRPWTREEVPARCATS